MEVWNPILWEFSRVMRECHRKVGTMLGKDRPPVCNGPIMGALRAPGRATQAELSELPACGMKPPWRWRWNG